MGVEAQQEYYNDADFFTEPPQREGEEWKDTNNSNYMVIKGTATALSAEDVKRFSKEGFERLTKHLMEEKSELAVEHTDTILGRITGTRIGPEGDLEVDFVTKHYGKLDPNGKKAFQRLWSGDMNQLSIGVDNVKKGDRIEHEWPEISLVKKGKRENTNIKTKRFRFSDSYQSKGEQEPRKEYIAKISELDIVDKPSPVFRVQFSSFSKDSTMEVDQQQAAPEQRDSQGQSPAPQEEPTRPVLGVHGKPLLTLRDWESFKSKLGELPVEQQSAETEKLIQDLITGAHSLNEAAKGSMSLAEDSYTNIYGPVFKKNIEEYGSGENPLYSTQDVETLKTIASSPKNRPLAEVVKKLTDLNSAHSDMISSLRKEVKSLKEKSASKAKEYEQLTSVVRASANKNGAVSKDDFENLVDLVEGKKPAEKRKAEDEVPKQEKESEAAVNHFQTLFSTKMSGSKDAKNENQLNPGLVALLESFGESTRPKTKF